MMEYSSNSNSYENEVGLVECTKNIKIVGCLWVKNDAPREWYDFDISKVEKIFDLLLQENHHNLPPNQVRPSPEEFKKEWCKWHNSPSHHTNECKVSWQQIHSTTKTSCRGTSLYTFLNLPLYKRQSHIFVTLWNVS
jgi:hypothetical protein